ncbi:hypothetical protein G9A89_017108 [Geosiphon pyriformis]|nr:hypothetical protein G9A89_017108 [Geosiphon pyriformis]
MTTTRAKSKKAALDICSEISNKISTREALSVVEATRQNVLEAFSLSSNHNKLSLVATKATFSSLTGFLPVKVLSKRHTWVSLSVVSTPTKSPKVFNNKLVNKLVFPSIASISGAASTSSSKKLIKKPKVQKSLDQPLTVLPNMVSSGRLLSVLEAKQSPLIRSSVLENWANQMETKSSSSLVFGATSNMPGATFKIKLAYVKAVFQLIHGFLDAKLVLKDNVKLFCMEFASQVFLEAVFLVELTSSVHLTTLKIAKFLVVSESSFFSAVVVLCDVLLGVSAADIKTALSVFGSVICVVLKPIGVWQYVVSVLVDKNSIRILPLMNQNETILSHNKFKAKLVNLSSGCTALKSSGCWSQFALIIFETPNCRHCFRCQEMGHLAANCKIFLSSPSKLSKVFTLCFVGPKSYAKIFAFLSSSEFPPLLPLVSSPVAVSDSLLSVLVKSIVKSIGSLVATFKQFINGDLVSSSAFGLRINEVLVYMGSFNKTIDKLEREVVSLKKKYCMEDINMSGDSELLFVVSDEWLVGLVSCSATLFSVIQKMLSLGKFSSIVLV